eukprot:m.59696 g.59696  ORF g.59696 m.59696 type:complete len:87 (-) comp22738_c0_seq2:16-276(-)
MRSPNSSTMQCCNYRIGFAKQTKNTNEQTNPNLKTEEEKGKRTLAIEINTVSCAVHHRTVFARGFKFIPPWFLFRSEVFVFILFLK